jgi:hypothetical protein
MKINWTVCGAALLVLAFAVLPRVEAGDVH